MNTIITDKKKMNYSAFEHILKQQNNTKVAITMIDLKTLITKTSILDNIRCGWWCDDNTPLFLFDYHFDNVRKSDDNCKLIAFYPPTLIYQTDNIEYHLTIIF